MKCPLRHFLAQAPRQWACSKVAASCLLMTFSLSSFRMPQGSSSVASSQTCEVMGCIGGVRSWLMITESTRGFSSATFCRKMKIFCSILDCKVSPCLSALKGCLPVLPSALPSHPSPLLQASRSHRDPKRQSLSRT